MTPLQHHSIVGFSSILPVINSSENAILLGLIQLENKKFKIIFSKTLSANFRKEIFQSFIDYEQTTHYFINHLTTPQSLREYNLEINKIIDKNGGIINFE